MRGKNYKIYKSPLGDILLLSDEEGLCGLYFDKEPNKDEIERDDEFLLSAASWLDIYFSKKEPDFTPKLHIRGSEFQKRVCSAMSEIPYGATITYSEIAKRIAKERGLDRMSSQAVGGAVGKNPISIIIPCHRVVGKSGSLTGYGGGIKRKIKLLELEGVDMSKLFVPKKGTKL